MAKKDFSESMNNSANVMNRVATGDTETTETKKPKYYRFNISMPYEFKDYLAKASYDASRPGHLVSITQYINDLIRADMEKNNWK